MLRRGYLYLKADVTKYLGFFTHIASDKVGQEGLDKASLGLGSGVAWRDAWASVNLHECAKIQLGRMYVPITRAYGTTSTKAMMTLDLPFLQGGSRGGIFYAQKVGRDDSVVLWGNPLDGLLQYRLMVGEGVEGDANPDDNVRVAGPGLDATSCGTLAELSQSDRQVPPNQSAHRRPVHALASRRDDLVGRDRGG